MTRRDHRHLVSIVLFCGLTVTSAHAQTTTPDSVKTRIGTLTFERGSTFKEFPPSQKPGSFSIDAALESLQRGAQ